MIGGRVALIIIKCSGVADFLNGFAVGNQLFCWAICFLETFVV